MICEHRIDGQCKLASEIAQATIECRDDAFKACTECACPHTFNYVVASLAYKYVPEQDRKTLIEVIRRGKNCILGGPGTELKKILTYLYIVEVEDCGCGMHAEQMNQWGAKECRVRLDEITTWMKEACESKKWKWIWNEFAARSLILMACDLSDGTQWTSIILRLPSILKMAYEKTSSEVSTITR